MTDERWTDLFGEDPRPWLLESEEPAARWITLVELSDVAPHDPEATAAHEAVLGAEGTRALLDRLVPWEREVPVGGHDKPDFRPNLLNLLADMGVRAEDDERISAMLDAMLEHQDDEGRFQALGRWRKMDAPVWGALFCDAHAIAETLARLGRADDPRVRRAFERMAEDLTETDMGTAWPCRKDPSVGFRGPGRKAEPCPQATLEALRGFSYLPAAERPAGVLDAARTSLEIWRMRGERKPFMFGHGRNFKRAKWPVTWYGAFEVTDALGRYPELWRDGAAEDRRSLAEIAACLAAYNVDGGRVTPKSAFTGFKEYSFGQKKEPSAFATARTAVVLRRLDELADDIQAVDVSALPSSKGGTGTPVPPS
jgi:hypothetical protein